MTTRTQAAAQRCADLANAEYNGIGYQARHFTETFADREAFRRYVETEDAMIREVLALLGQMPGGHPKHAEAITLLRANLLSDPQPTLLEEFLNEQEWATGKLNESERKLVGHALDWIAKREVKS